MRVSLTFHSIAASVLIGPHLLRAHLLTIFIWVIVFSFESMIAHSNFAFPVIELFLDSARHHNYHHRHYGNNYGIFFGIWDRVLGTDKGYREHERVRKMKLMKRVSPTEK